MSRRPSDAERWARDYRAGQGQTNLQRSTQQHVSRGGGGGGNRNRNNRGTCVCMVLTTIGGLAVVAWHAVHLVLTVDPVRFL